MTDDEPPISITAVNAAVHRLTVAAMEAQPGKKWGMYADVHEIAPGLFEVRIAGDLLFMFDRDTLLRIAANIAADQN